MGGSAAVNAVPIVGQPVAFGMGFVALLLVGLSTVVAGYFQTYAHEGGHMLATFGLAHRVTGYWIYENRTGLLGLTTTVTPGLSNVVVGFAGYATPPLLGLGGAALIATGNPFAVLVALVIFSTLAVLVARNGLAFLVPALVIAGVVATAVKGTAALQAAFAVGSVWFLLISGTVDAFRLPTTAGDAANLASRTVVVPGFVWKLIWIVIAVVSLYVGGRLLLIPSA